jgi:hypothetical protein
MGLGWRVEWGFGLWFFHLLLYPTINSCNPFNYGLSIYGRNKDNYPIQLRYFVAGSLKTIQVKEKKRQARADYVRPSRVLRAKCNNRRRESWLLIGLAWLLKLGFLGRYQYICWKKEEEGIRLQIFKFFGGWVWSEGKKKGRHGRIVFDRHGHPLVITNLKFPTQSQNFIFQKSSYKNRPIR